MTSSPLGTWLIAGGAAPATKGGQQPSAPKAPAAAKPRPAAAAAAATPVAPPSPSPAAAPAAAASVVFDELGGRLKFNRV